MLPQDLIDAEAAHKAASVVSEAARIERNRLVQAAIDAGWTHAKIAETSGLTRARIGQVAHRMQPGRPERPL